MSVSNKDRGVNKKIRNILKELFKSDSNIYIDIKNGIDKLEESELLKLINDIFTNNIVNLSSDKIKKIGVRMGNVFPYLITVNLPNVTSIGNYAFSGCSNSTSIDLPNVTSIGDYAFFCCTSLTSIDLPNVTSIGDSAFSGCSNLTSIDLPNAPSIGDNTFYDCTSLTSIDLPNVTSIGGYAFYDCTSLTSIDLPNVTSIGGYAFNRCTSLTKIIIGTDSDMCTLKSTNTFDNTPIANGTGYIYVPDDKVDTYKSATNWSTYASQIKPISELPSEE